MTDRREDILSRIRDILEEVPGIVRAGRNVEDVSGGASARPAAILYDGSEDNADYSGRPKFSPKDYVTMTPQIVILLGARSEAVGTRVNDIRRLLIPLVYQDATIKQLCTPAGDITYRSGALDTSTGETREARFEIRFDITYLMDSREMESM